MFWKELGKVDMGIQGKEYHPEKFTFTEKGRIIIGELSGRVLFLHELQKNASADHA